MGINLVPSTGSASFRGSEAAMHLTKGVEREIWDVAVGLRQRRLAECPTKRANVDAIGIAKSK